MDESRAMVTYIQNKNIQRDTTQNVNGRMAELITLQRAKRYIEKNTCDGYI